MACEPRRGDDGTDTCRYDWEVKCERSGGAGEQGLLPGARERV